MALAVTARTQDPTLVELVDALVEAIDTDRSDAIERLRDALDPFGAAGLFDAELRLNGLSGSGALCSLCGFDLDDEVAV